MPKYEKNPVRDLDLDRRHRYNPPFGDQPERYVELRSFARKLADLIETNCPEGREKSLAHTNLEQCVFWANAAIARHERDE